MLSLIATEGMESHAGTACADGFPSRAAGRPGEAFARGIAGVGDVEGIEAGDEGVAGCLVVGLARPVVGPEVLGPTVPGVTSTGAENEAAGVGLASREPEAQEP